MNKQEIYDFIKSKNIWYEITEHKAVYNMQELSEIDLPYKEADGKNLFVRDDKKRNYYLITLKGNKKLDLKSFSDNFHLRRLSFASENDLMDILNLKPGSVTPLGLLNDKDLKVIFHEFCHLKFKFLSITPIALQRIVDRISDGYIVLNDEGIIGIHPNDNTATLWLKVPDLINIIKEHGNQANIVKID